ncbi:MAG: AzlC family ABC transporter permease [Clostridia bacterium]|nr:AzlC family ABC transporter permease [Clostridia bacterium]
MSKFTLFKRGFRNGIPIFLGYLAVSFTFGIAARDAGLTSFQAVLISATNLTSAGQFAALGIIATQASYIEMALTQLVINLRYCLMSSSLSQRFDEKMKPHHRFFIAFGVTDEIFGVSSAYLQENVPPAYCYGLIAASWPGWVLGTALGCLSGSILPASVLSALGVALYGMFIAIIVPPTKNNRVLLGIVIISMLLSLVFAITPILKGISSGFRVIILTIIIAGAAAYFFPVEEEGHYER